MGVRIFWGSKYHVTSLVPSRFRVFQRATLKTLWGEDYTLKTRCHYAFYDSFKVHVHVSMHCVDFVENALFKSSGDICDRI